LPYFRAPLAVLADALPNLLAATAQAQAALSHAEPVTTPAPEIVVYDDFAFFSHSRLPFPGIPNNTPAGWHIPSAWQSPPKRYRHRKTQD
jgi:hypothetical protein